MPFRYPVSLELAGRRCVVVGGGEVAEHKVRGLLAAGAAVTVVAGEVTPGLDELARRGEIDAVRRPYARGDLAGAFLAIAATGHPAVNAEVFAEAEEARVLLNAVDDVAHCHFAVPSVVRRGEFTVAVSTGGKAPALAKRLRRRLARQFGREYGALVDLLGEVREEALPRRTVDFETWAARWQRALEGGVLGLVREGRLDQAREAVRRALDGEDDPPTGRVWIVGAGPGDPDLISLRGREALDSAEVVVADRLVHPSLVAGKETVDVGKEPGRPHMAQEEINALLVDLARSGKTVVRLKGGDPFVFGRGAEEAEALAEAGVPFEVVPGPTSAIAALAAAGIPVTDRRYSSSVAIVTGHCAPGREVDWRRLATSVDTVVVLMGVSRLAEIAEGLLAGGRDATTPAAVVERGTLPDQRVVEGDLATIAAAAAGAGVRPPAVLVVGEVVRVRDRLRTSANRYQGDEGLNREQEA